MDDALVLLTIIGLWVASIDVLILVVMDDALVQTLTLRTIISTRVLILVVMDDALVRAISMKNLVKQESLNPCCNG